MTKSAPLASLQPARPAASRRRLTAHDIARHAGVSHTTVARVMSGNASYAISANMRERVMKSARELGYYPNPFARFLQNQRSNIIGLCANIQPAFFRPTGPFKSWFHFDRRLAGISLHPRHAEYHQMILTRDDESPDLEADLFKKIEYLDGLIYINARRRDQPMLKRLARRVPLVLEDAPGLPEFNSVSMDQYQVVDEAVRLLVARGSRRVGMIIFGSIEYLQLAERLKAFEKTLKDLGLPFSEDHLATHCMTPNQIYQQMTRMLRMQPRIDGVLVPRDDGLLACLRAIEDCGLRVGREIKLINTHDTQATEHFRPGITSINNPIDEISSGAFNLLLDLIDGKVSAPRHILIPGAIVERESTLGTDGDSRPITPPTIAATARDARS